MNNKQRSSNDEPNRNPNSANERQLAQHTARVLELQPLEAQSTDDQATVELGRLLRDAAQANLPDSSLDLREQLMTELAGGSATPESDQVASKEVTSEEVTSKDVPSSEVSSRSTGRRFWIAAAASGLLLVGGTIAYNSGFVGTLSNVAVLDKSEQPSVEAVADRSTPIAKPETPEVVFRMETKTRMAPIQKMSTETKTRSVPVIKYRNETKQVKQADGSIKTETVKVPYAEQAQQNYTVQVPYTENVSQSYAVPVPYTADGKRIEKSDYGKYGLNDQGRRGGSGAQSSIASLKDTNTKLEKTLEFEKASRAQQLADLQSLNRASQSQLSGQGFAEAEPQAPRGGGLMPQSDESKATGGMVFPDADTWSDKQVRRQNFKNFRLSGEQEGESGRSHGGVAALPSSRPVDFMFGGEVPFRVAGTEVVQTTPGVTMFDGQAESGVQPNHPRSSLIGSPVMPANEPGRFDSNLYGDKDIRSHGFSGRGTQQIAQETRMVEELELQRDQLIIVSNYGPGHANINAINRAINERKAKIEQLEKESERYGYFEPNTGGEQYEPIFENAFIAAKGPAAISTFSIDVDTASYANMRRMLNSGRRPPPNSIRLEELVNYFQYDYAQPTGDHPFSVNLELADCPWEAGQQLLRVALKGKDIQVGQRPPTNVVFLIDVSGSMSSNDKLPLLKSGFQMMSRQLGENDRVSIVTYAGNAGVALEPTNGTQASTINTAIERLSSGGSTHGSAGIKLAYELAQQNFIQGGVNRVMLATDGDLNVGVTSDDALVTLIKEKAAEGVFLTVLGFGSGNLKDAKLEKLADNGNGMYAYIDSTREAHRVLVDQLSGSLVTIAKDVKIQVEFNPAEVKSYRLLGYENRMLETKDFDDDAKDAGEIGAGHTVTAIYQIEPAKAVSPNVSLPAGMKYQVKSDTDQASDVGEDTDKDGLSKAALSGDLATVALRYKQPDASESERLEVSIKNQTKRFEEASADFRFAAGVAGFGMYLRNSEHRGSIDAVLLQRIASESIGKDESGYRSEFIDLIRRATNR